MTAAGAGPVRFRSAREAEEYLLGFINYEVLTEYRATSRTHDLRRFARVLQDLGWERNRVPTVHVAGTNGKGSVSLLLESILRAGGVRTGLYTSPHLETMRERIQVAGRPISRAGFREGVSRLGEAFRAEPGAGFRTTFEHLTGLAFLAFQEAGVERAVVEVGLGGRLDATNVLPPGPAVLTPVARDHTRILGSTLARIAADKAHVFKRGGTAFVMPQVPSAERAVETRLRALRMGGIRTAEAVQVRLEGAGEEGAAFLVMGAEDYGTIRTRLWGSHQGQNLAAAVAVAESLLPASGRKQAVRSGLRRVRLPARLERFEGGNAPVLVDGGHNPAAARAVAAALALHAPGRRVVAVVGMARDKEHRSFLRALSPVVSEWIFTASSNPRAAAPARLAAELGSECEVVADSSRALEQALARRPDFVLVAGSFVLAGEVRRHLREATKG
jgi:dihydrofolate synthase/folylpolyglutamate synthase